MDIDEDDEHLVGYASRLSAGPDERVDFMVSTSSKEYEIDLVRLTRREARGDDPGVNETVIVSDLPKSRPGRRQTSRPGSCVYVPEVGCDLASITSLDVSLWVHPTMLRSHSRQVLISTIDPITSIGWESFISTEGEPSFLISGTEGSVIVGMGQSLEADRWTCIRAGFDLAQGLIRVGAYSSPDRARSLAKTLIKDPSARIGCVNGMHSALLIAARHRSPASSTCSYGSYHFNGRIEDVRLFSPMCEPDEDIEELPAENLLSWWDFGINVCSDTIIDRGRLGRNGVVINTPHRAVIGHKWDREVYDFRQRPEAYGAIHFHEDDLRDAKWDTDFFLTIPRDLPSGVYAARCQAGNLRDHIPFIVVPSIGQPKADTVVVLPTLTYQAYANNRVALEKDFLSSGVVGRVPVHDAGMELLSRHPEWGRSLYDTHADGSGCAYASLLRPLVNMRPHHNNWITGGPRNFSLDLCLLYWLEVIGIAVDVITDRELHNFGVDAIAPYRVVLTGSHPEYATSMMLDALESYLECGGNLMYLGGNGFYWVASIHPEFGEVMEVRRGNNGTRPWNSRPGEMHHSTSGELGGLWRNRGRPPNALVGVGFTAQGWDDRAGYYRRTAESFDARYRWIFEGVEADEKIGDFGLIMDGAAGDEIDRYDSALGMSDAIELARSEGHSEHYCVAVEDLLQTTPNISAVNNELVHSSLVYAELLGGGKVFSVGSMCWVGSLPFNDCANNVSAITRNVLLGFLD